MVEFYLFFIAAGDIKQQSVEIRHLSIWWYFVLKVSRS